MRLRACVYIMRDRPGRAETQVKRTRLLRRGHPRRSRAISCEPCFYKSTWGKQLIGDIITISKFINISHDWADLMQSQSITRPQTSLAALFLRTSDARLAQALVLRKLGFPGTVRCRRSRFRGSRMSQEWYSKYNGDFLKLMDSA